MGREREIPNGAIKNPVLETIGLCIEDSGVDPSLLADYFILRKTILSGLDQDLLTRYEAVLGSLISSNFPITTLSQYYERVLQSERRAAEIELLGRFADLLPLYRRNSQPKEVEHSSSQIDLVKPLMLYIEKLRAGVPEEQAALEVWPDNENI